MDIADIIKDMRLHLTDINLTDEELAQLIESGLEDISIKTRVFQDFCTITLDSNIIDFKEQCKEFNDDGSIA